MQKPSVCVSITNEVKSDKRVIVRKLARVHGVLIKTIHATLQKDLIVSEVGKMGHQTPE
jgi:hypothetical protein